MSGFFKKLFNRIIGKKEETPPPAEAPAGLMPGVAVLEFALSLQNLDQGGRMEVSRGVSCEYRREPLGVVAGITPFNFPAMVPMWMIPIAIGVGMKPQDFIKKVVEKTGLGKPAIVRELNADALRLADELVKRRIQ